ncbi:DMT family transporter [Telmatospirillum siberiense]|uniref:EamA family transporter n=1 Tax=Telmatospirillum siberiense TaxID=382514 RepID=A0A2N3PXS0_9PROT|nr:DMT family transporter [Telmatospirillum siberiense]PKU25161.1 EamA family transporter [Telmatospirillum siberiense]
MPSDRRLQADGLLVLVTILAAAGWFFSLYALQSLPTMFFMGARFLLGGLILACFGFRPLLSLGRRDLRRSVLTGIAMCASMMFWVAGLLVSDNLGVGAFICALGNIVAPLFGRVLFRIPVSRATWLAVGVATAGLACLSLKDGIGFSLADLYFLGTAVTNSLYLNLNNRYASRIPVMPLAAIQLMVVGLLSLATSAARESWPTTVGMEAVGWFLASVLISTSLRFFLLVRGQKTAPISHTALIMNLEPVWTALLALICLGTAIGGIQLAGCGLIFLALVLHHLPWRGMRAF